MTNTNSEAFLNEVKTIKNINKKFLFGLISFSYLVEDRRPDLNSEEHKDKIKELTYKYKHLIEFKFFTYNCSLIIRSINSGFCFINKKEV